MERLTALEKKVDEKDKAIMDILKSISTRINVGPHPTPTPSFSYANIVGTGLGSTGLAQGRPGTPSTPGGPGTSTATRDSTGRELQVSSVLEMKMSLKQFKANEGLLKNQWLVAVEPRILHAG